MKMNNEIKNELSEMTESSKSLMLDVIEIIEKRAEITPKGSVFFYDILPKALWPAPLEKLSVLDRFKEWKVLKKEYNLNGKNSHINMVVDLKNLHRVKTKIEKSMKRQQGMAEVTLSKKELIIELNSGNLKSYNDGTIRYDDEILNIRKQLSELCRLFMSRNDQVVNYDEIRDQIISNDKRDHIGFSTIAKYVSELHTSLKVHYKKKVIFTSKGVGWYFKP